jgi:HK97 family phage major capsid protein
MQQIKTGTLHRFFEIDREAVDTDSRTVNLSFSSEQPVERSFGVEVLDHSPESVRMDRLRTGAPLLLNHDLNDQIGIVEGANIENGRGLASVRFSKSARGEEVYQDILDGIRGNVSVGYRIHEMTQDAANDDVFRATDWEPLEVSIVSVPADQSVGVGRSDGDGDHMTRVIQQTTEDIQMDENTVQQIDIEAVRNEARDAALAEEQGRISAINSMAKGAPYLRDIADKALETGTPLDEFQRSAFDVVKDQLKHKVTDIPDAPIRAANDLTFREQKSYSLFRAIQAQVSGDWSNAGFERELSDAIGERVGQSNGGFYLPTDMPWGQRDLTVGTNTAGGHLVGTDHFGSSFIDSLRARMVTMSLGARLMANLRGNVAIPAMNAATSVYWVAEGAAPTEGAPTFRQVTLSPKNVAAYVDISRNLMIQSDPSVEAIIRDDITMGVAQAIDTVALNGGGSNEPSGVLQTTGIGSVTLADQSGVKIPTWGEVIDIETEVSQDNALDGSLAYVMPPAVAGGCKQTAKDSGSGLFIMDGNSINGYPVAVTSNCPANTIIFGNWSDLIIGQFGAVEVLTERSASTGILTLGIHLAVDVGVRHAESFAKGV